MTKELNLLLAKPSRMVRGECLLQVTATAEVSQIQTAGPVHRRRIQGALLADGFNCFLSACAMTLPVTTFAQNNGVCSYPRLVYSLSREPETGHRSIVASAGTTLRSCARYQKYVEFRSSRGLASRD